MTRQTALPAFHPPVRQTLALAACVLALSLAFAAGARAQDDDDDDDEAAAPLVVDIDGPCLLTIKGLSVPCRGVAYMVFPSNHRINFTAITDTAGWAFSGEDDDNRNGRYALKLDSVLNLGSGRLDAEGRCVMQVGDDRRTVRSLDCRAGAGDGDELVLTASGTITLEDAGNDDGDGFDDGDDDDSVVS